MTIHTYAKNGDTDGVREQLASGIAVDTRDENDFTPLAYAVSNAAVPIELLSLLFEAGADVDASVENGKTFLSHGWNVNEQGRQKETALMCCASANHPEMMAWLLDNGASTEIVDDSKNTALILAAQVGAAECVRLLLNAGATPNSRNEYNDAAIGVASTIETVRQLQRAGEDIRKICTEMKRTLVGVSHFNSLDCSRDAYHEGKEPRFGNANPQRMDFAFWQAMVRAGCDAYHARAKFEDTDTLDTPVWCFSRFGCSLTELPDGRFVQIGGEHEDHYDPDFCIYNDVIVHSAPGEFSIYGYPENVFRPTDFHTATYVDGYLYIVGCLGYHGTREFGATPVYRLSCTDWRIEAVETAGENPGWIYDHGIRVTEPEVLCVSGGKAAFEQNGEEVHEDLENDYLLNLKTRSWKRVS